MQCVMLEYQLGLKTASVQGAIKTSMYYRYQHILSGVTQRSEMAANREVCVRKPGQSQMFSKPVTQASASFTNVHLVAGATFDEVYHIVTGACMFTMASYTTSRCQ